MIIHEQDCQYRTVNCAHLNCYAKHGLFNYVAHFDQAHKSPSFEGGKTHQIPFSIATTCEGIAWNPMKITAFHATFFEVGTVCNGNIYRWIYLLGSKDEAKNYAFHATLENKTAEEKISYYGPVRSMDVPHTEIAGKLPCFLVNVSSVQAFKIGAANDLKYSVKIRCLKDEAKDEDAESGIDD